MTLCLYRRIRDAMDNSPENQLSGSTTGLDGDGVNKDVAGDTDAICDPGLTPDYSYPSCQKSRANTCSWTQCQADDVEFAMALVDTIKAKLCIDAKRVHGRGALSILRA